MDPAAAGPLVVGVPTEVKSDERRVALTPDGVREMESRGVEVLVQSGAGLGAAIPDDAYVAAGAELVADPAELWARAGLVCKVKEPQAGEVPYLRSEEHTSELQSLMRIPYAVFRLKKKNNT